MLDRNAIYAGVWWASSHRYDGPVPVQWEWRDDGWAASVQITAHGDRHVHATGGTDRDVADSVAMAEAEGLPSGPVPQPSGIF